MTIREISKKATMKRNELILKMLLKHSVKFVADRFAMSQDTIYKIAQRNKKKLYKLYKSCPN
jgi:DNA-directed RNA polymerase specialized sigma24 family protein